MASIAFALLFLAIAGAIVAWVAGAMYFVRTLAAIGEEERSTRWLALIAWPFAVSRLNAKAAAYAVGVNRAIVAFIACLLIAAASMSVGMNLQRVTANAAATVQK